jgi:hypothetical protein
MHIFARPRFHQSVAFATTRSPLALFGCSVIGPVFLFVITLLDNSL